MPDREEERRRFFVERALQGRFMGYTVIILVLYSLFLLFIQKLYTMMVLPILFLIAVVGILLIILLPSMFFTHRFFGPLSRLERHAQLMASRDLSQKVRLRRGDNEAIRRLADCFNSLSQNLKESLAEAQRLHALLQEKTARLTAILEGGKPYREDPVALMEEIRSLQNELDQLLQSFKLV